MCKLGLIFSLCLLNAGLEIAQQPGVLVLPPIGGISPTKPAAEKTKDDPADRYANRHEAALAALQAGYKAATFERNADRAMRYFLVSLRRDPTVSLTLYNVAVLCAQEERWRDSLDFYHAAQQAKPDAALAKLISAEIERVQTIEQLERTRDGKKRRSFDSRLLEVVQINDPFAALTAINELIKADKARWESFALAGIMHSKAGAFPESLQSLQSAATQAPAARQSKLKSAAELARREASFSEQVRNADEFWEKQQYDAAAKLYAKAWEDSPGHLNVAMEAATGFLLSDQISFAVEVLAQLRDSRSDELSSKAVTMLKELGAVTESAKNEAVRKRAGTPSAQSGDAAERIALLVGTLTTAQMELAAKPNPAFIQDKTVIITVQDEELTAGRNDAPMLTTESVYARYLKDRASRAPTEPEAAPPIEAPSQQPPLAETQPLRRVSQPLADAQSFNRATVSSSPPQSVAAPKPVETVTLNALAPTAAPLPRGSQKGVSVNFVSRPSGSAVVFDENPNLTCTTPCLM